MPHLIRTTTSTATSASDTAAIAVEAARFGFCLILLRLRWRCPHIQETCSPLMCLKTLNFCFSP
eukprot:UN06744